MDKQKAEQLINKYLEGNCTAEEKLLVEKWYNDAMEQQEPLPVDNNLEEIGSNIYNRLPFAPDNTRKLWPRIAAIAASVLLIISVGGYFLLHKQKLQEQIAVNPKHDLMPGSNKAVLTIGGGQKIALTGAQNGQIAVQGNTTINKTQDGRVVYDAEKGTNSSNTVVYNTLTTPRGGKYDLILADGTKVWLDAASSITYPVTFTGHDRNVAITGQAYFEVVHNAAKPFKVTVNGQTVEVLGTHFNVNAYQDEAVMKTTLLEGSVRITKNGQSAMLVPGQQAIVASGEKVNITVKEADTEEAVAWKNGYFSFNHADIKTVMRSLGRWYDVEIAYEGEVPAKSFTGEIHRNLAASQVFDILSYLDIKFRVEGKRIIVTNTK